MSMDNTVPVKIITQHDKFLTRLVDAGVYATKAEANRAGIVLLMDKYPQFADFILNPQDETPETPEEEEEAAD